MAWFAALRDTARTGLSFDRALSDPRRALRGAVAAALVVFPVLAVFGPGPATSAAMGAFIAGTATFQRSFRPRTSLAIAAGIGLGVSTCLGYLAVGVPGAFPVLLACWAFAAGLAWAIGPTGGVVASNTLSVMLVVVQLPVSAVSALGHGLLCSVGGAVQALVVSLWPIGNWAAQREALADLYAGLADYARRLRQDPVAPFDPAPFMVARQAAALTPWQERRRPPELHGLRGIAERIRPALAALSDPGVGAPAEGPERDRARELLAATAEVLDALARAIRSGESLRMPRMTPSLLLARPAGESGAARGWDTWSGTGTGSTGERGGGAAGPSVAPPPPGGDRAEAKRRSRAVARAARRITGLLARAADTLERHDESTVSGPPAEGLRRPSLWRLLPSAVQTVGRQLNPHSAIFQHAVRMAGVVTAAYLAARLLGLRHGYWAPMTAVMVMRPDFAQTFSRGVARLAGTATGVLAATGIVQLFHPGQLMSAALAVVCMGGAYLTLRTGYAVMTACVSSYVVFLLGLQLGDPVHTAFERVLMTLLGGAVALGAYALFPTWQTARLPERLAEWLAAAGRYGAATFAAFGDPADRRGGERVRAALLDFREARSETLQALERAAVEPVSHAARLPELPRKQIDRARAALGLLARSTMLMEAHLPAVDAPPVPGAGEFAEELRDATAIAAAAVLLGQPADFAALREAHTRWDAELARLPADDRIETTRAGARLVLRAVADLEKAVRPRGRLQTDRH